MGRWCAPGAGEDAAVVPREGHLGASPALTMTEWPGLRPSLNSSTGETEAMAALGAILVA